MIEFFINKSLMDKIKKTKKNIPDDLMEQVKAILDKEFEENVYKTIKSLEDLLFDYKRLVVLNLLDDIEEEKRLQISLAFFALGLRQLEYKIYNKALENFEFSLSSTPTVDVEILDKMSECYLKTGRGDLIISKILLGKKDVIEQCKSEEILFAAMLHEILEKRSVIARYYFEKIRKLNSNIEKVFRYPNLPAFILTKRIDIPEIYSEDSIITLIQRYSEFFTTPYYYEKISYFSKNKLSDEEISKIANRFNGNSSKKEFDGLNYNIVRIFRNNDIFGKEDIETYTKKELLAIKGIGMRTIETLEENGVRFREK